MVSCTKSISKEVIVKEKSTKVDNTISYPKGYDITSSGASS